MARTKEKPKRRKAGNDLIDKRMEALSHPVRRKIMAYFTNEGPGSPSTMAKVIGESLEDVAYHAKRLVALGCAEVADIQAHEDRPPEKIYRATERHLVATEDWEDLDQASKDGASAEYAQLFIDDLVEAFKAETLGTHKYFALIQNRITVDEQGRDEAIEIEERAMREIQELQARAVERLSDAEEEGLRFSVLQGCIEVPPRPR